MFTPLRFPFDAHTPSIRQLRAGNLRCIYESGNLRYIKLGETELVRMLYGAVRDKDWDTVPCAIANEKIKADGNSFSISYTAHYVLAEIDYKADFIIEGKTNSITVTMHGQARSGFQSNRIGLCVHHPLMECCGEPIAIEHTDGAFSQTQFPTSISPHQPFLSIKNMHWQAAGVVPCSLFFDGDTFETEDQRNWTDSSFKTYSRPLSLPFPFTVNRGDAVLQTIVLKAGADAPQEAMAPKKQQQLIIENPFPEIGFQKRQGYELDAEAAAFLKKAPLHHYRVELHFNTNQWQQEWAQALNDAEKLGTLLELILFFDGVFSKQLYLFIQTITPHVSRIHSILPLMAATATTSEALLKTAVEHIKNLDGSIKTGWGTDGFFAELNRNRPPALPYDFVSFSINPQVHLFDTISLMENLEAQAHTVQTVKTFAPHVPVHISPITFATRKKSSATEAAQWGFDQRQQTHFGAWWLLMATGGLSAAQQLTFGTAAGPYGLLAKQTPEQGYTATPFYKTLAAIKDFAPQKIKADLAQQTATLQNRHGAKRCCKLDK